jgi:hypothetical protein
MTIASNAVGVDAGWPDEIPRDYKELHEKFGNFVSAQIRKHNKVGRNFDELHAHIWKRLVEKDVISLFMTSVQQKLPRQLTAVQACDFLGVSFEQWRVQMWRFHTGIPIRSKHDRSVVIGRYQHGWMPTPINAGEFEDACVQRNAKLLAAGKSPKAITNGLRSRHAIFAISDIERLVEMMKKGEGPFKKTGPIQPPIIKATKAHFQAYLSKSIYSDFANWCRTYVRKWSQDRPMYIRDGADESEENWEQKLEDPGGARQETSAVLKEAVTRISHTLHESMRGVDTLQCKPVAQTEMQLFELLEQSVPLPEALRKLDVPERVRRAVLKSVADYRSRAA